MPAVKNVGEPCAGEPHARFEVAAGGNQPSRQCRAVQAPPVDPPRLRLGPDGSYDPKRSPRRHDRLRRAPAVRPRRATWLVSGGGGRQARRSLPPPGRLRAGDRNGDTEKSGGRSGAKSESATARPADVQILRDTYVARRSNRRAHEPRIRRPAAPRSSLGSRRPSFRFMMSIPTGFAAGRAGQEAWAPCRKRW